MCNDTLYIMSLFANVGISETYLNRIKGVTVKLANELDSKRADFYSKMYPDVEMIQGDITDDVVKKTLIQKGIQYSINLIIATPPCQGMSVAGKQKKNDIRNLLIKDAVEIVNMVQPDYVLFENVPEQFNTKILYREEWIRIPEYISELLGHLYQIETRILDAADYGVAQSRKRLFFLLTKKDKKQWSFPVPDAQKITLEHAIGNLPTLDPYVTDISEEELLTLFPDFYTRKKEAEQISKWHSPPRHTYRHVQAMMHTPTGKSAFDNKSEFRPRKKDGTLIKGFHTAYKRQEWDKPAFTITMQNGSISSQNNVHPGRYIGTDENGDKLYSDARVLTLYELMKVSSLPDNWNIPDGYTEHFIRGVIGEGIPPELMYRLVKNIFGDGELSHD